MKRQEKWERWQTFIDRPKTIIAVIILASIAALSYVGRGDLRLEILQNGVPVSAVDVRVICDAEVASIKTSSNGFIFLPHTFAGKFVTFSANKLGPLVAEGVFLDLPPNGGTLDFVGSNKWTITTKKFFLPSTTTYSLVYPVSIRSKTNQVVPSRDSSP